MKKVNKYTSHKKTIQHKNNWWPPPIDDTKEDKDAFRYIADDNVQIKKDPDWESIQYARKIWKRMLKLRHTVFWIIKLKGQRNNSLSKKAGKKKSLWMRGRIKLASEFLAKFKARRHWHNGKCQRKESMFQEIFTNLRYHPSIKATWDNLKHEKPLGI